MVQSNMSQPIFFSEGNLHIFEKTGEGLVPRESDEPGRGQGVEYMESRIISVSTSVQWETDKNAYLRVAGRLTGGNVK